MGKKDQAMLEQLLKEAGVAYEAVDHPPVFTCEEASKHLAGVRGIPTKNLLLKSKRGSYFLIVTGEGKRVDLNALARRVGETRLSFASSDDLQSLLGVAPGAVTVLAVINDEARRIRVLCDEEIWRDEPLHCHPLVNTRTLLLKPADISRLFTAHGLSIETMAMPERGDS